MMCFIKFSIFILLSINLFDVVLSSKKPIVDETKILENLETYERLSKQALIANRKSSSQVILSHSEKPIKPIKYNPRNIYQARTTKKNPKLLVIGLDGFRFDYVDLYNARTFKKLQNRGVYAKEGLISMFCTKTFPNYFSLSTGLYQETHGIVDNYFRDSKLNKVFDVYTKETQRERFWFTEAEPIWLTAIKQGKTVGSIQWPATDPFDEYLSEFLPYDPALNFSSRLSLSYDWLFKRDLDLVLTYYHQPDDTGHYHGPFSKQVQQEINIIDNELSKLIDRLDTSNSLDQFNLLIVSDHGMSVAKDLSYKVYLSDYIDVRDTSIEVMNQGAVVQIDAKPEQIDEIFNKLRYSAQHYRIYRKEDLTKRLHYGYLNRLLALVLIADEGYQIFKDRESQPFYIGNHGWDNELYSMRPLFYGIGTDLKKNYAAKTFETINLYNLMCRLLDLKPSPNNGTMQIVDNLLI